MIENVYEIRTGEKGEEQNKPNDTTNYNGNLVLSTELVM